MTICLRLRCEDSSYRQGWLRGEMVRRPTWVHSSQQLCVFCHSQRLEPTASAGWLLQVNEEQPHDNTWQQQALEANHASVHKDRQATTWRGDRTGHEQPYESHTDWRAT